MPLSAPPTSTEELIHGVVVRDPYRWLENGQLPETEEWIRAQKDKCDAYFSSCESFAELRGRVQEFLNVEVVDQPTRVGNYCFYRRRQKDQQQACIYGTESASNRERLLVDPSEKGPFTSVAIHRISEDASLLAFEVKDSGADTCRIHVIDVTSGCRLPVKTEIGYARGFAFARVKGGFYACHESSGAADHQIRFHAFHTTQADRILFVRPRTPGSRLVLMADTVHLGAMWIRRCKKELVSDFFVALREKDDDWQPVFLDKALPSSPILYRGRIFVLSYESALSGKVIELNADGLEMHTIVPEAEAPIRQVMIAGDRFVISRLRNGRSSIGTWTLAGDDEGEIDIPGDGTAEVLPQLGPPGASFFFTCQSFTSPPAIYEHATGTRRSTLWSRPTLSFEPADHQVRRLTLLSNDAVEIPITLVRRSAEDNVRPQPVIMTSYGGFGVLMSPQFSVFVTIMLELGAAFALPHIRGGGEYGIPWHEAGRGRNRQTAFDDFIAAAEWLCAEGITSPSKLGIFGGSNAGLLVGAAMTQRPDLFRAVLSIAPLLDMVRYERFDQAAKWRCEFVSAEDQDDFNALYAYSPYHHVSEIVDYPATLFVSGYSDDRCNPAHVRKMAARLQSRTAQQNPILVDYSKERGHSPVLPLSVRIDALARRLALFVKELGIHVPSEACDDPADR
jgi:prolyl oligopeptidase